MPYFEDIPWHILKEARAEMLKLEELKKNKPAGELCKKCNCIAEPFWHQPFHKWITNDICKPCIEKEQNENRAKKEKYIKELSKEEREILDKISVRKNQREENKSNSGIDIESDLWDMTFDTFKDGGTVYNNAKKYAKAFEQSCERQGLYIFGPVGSGKTHLSCAIANYVLKNTRYSVKFTKAIGLLLDARDYDTNKNEAKFINDLNEFNLLIIDDLGTEKLSEWAIQIIYKIIDDRLLLGKPLIVTSNFSLQELEEKIGGVSGERIVSRLATMCRVIKMPDRDYRLAKKITPKLSNQIV